MKADINKMEKKETVDNQTKKTQKPQKAIHLKVYEITWVTETGEETFRY